MNDLSSLFPFLESIPVVPIVSGVVLLFWIIFSFSITYHWVVYSRNPVAMAFVLVLYYGVSLFLIGSIVSNF